MPKFLRIILLSLTVVPSARADCSRDEAYEKMMALNQFGFKLQAQFPVDPRKADPEKTNAMVDKLRDYNTRLGKGGPLLAANKFGEACALYDQLAKDYQVDWKSNKTLPLKEIEKDGGKPPGGTCDLTAAAKKMADLSQKFQAAYAGGKITDLQSREFSTDTAPIGPMMQTNPSQACADIDKVRGKYGL